MLDCFNFKSRSGCVQLSNQPTPRLSQGLFTIRNIKTCCSGLVHITSSLLPLVGLIPKSLKGFSLGTFQILISLISITLLSNCQTNTWCIRTQSDYVFCLHFPMLQECVSDRFRALFTLLAGLKAVLQGRDVPCTLIWAVRLGMVLIPLMRWASSGFLQLQHSYAAYLSYRVKWTIKKVQTIKPLIYNVPRQLSNVVHTGEMFLLASVMRHLWPGARHQISLILNCRMTKLPSVPLFASLAVKSTVSHHFGWRAISFYFNVKNPLILSDSSCTGVQYEKEGLVNFPFITFNIFILFNCPFKIFNILIKFH